MFPIERVLLLASFEEALVEAGASPTDALAWTPSELEERWLATGLAIEAPWDHTGYPEEPERPEPVPLSPYMQAVEAM